MEQSTDTYDVESIVTQRTYHHRSLTPRIGDDLIRKMDSALRNDERAIGVETILNVYKNEQLLPASKS